MIKRVYLLLAMSAIMLSGCSSESDEVKNNVASSSEETTEKGTESDINAGLDPNKGIGTRVRLHTLSRNEETGEVKYGYFLDETITYEGSDIELGVTTGIDLNDRRYDTVEGAAIMTIGGQLVPFSIDGGEKKICHNVTLSNGGEQKQIISFAADMLEKGEKTDWCFTIVPFVEEYRHVADESQVLQFGSFIESTVDRTNYEQVATEYCTEGYFFDTTENVYGKTLNEICPYSGAVRDFILQDKNGKWMYLGSHPKGKSIVLLFCDGQLYEGFDGSYGMMINKIVTGYVNKEIDISKLSVGTHTMHALVLVYDENGELSIPLFKSLKGEITIE